MRRPVVLLAGLVAVVLLAGLAGAYAYFFSGLRTAPRSLSSHTASPSASSAPAATSATAASLVGNWTVSGASLAGYRVREQFAGQSSAHEAVARTSDVSGGLTIDQGPSGLEATAIKFTAQLSSLQSVAQVAGFNVSQRDRIVSRSLSVNQYPEATFQGQSVSLPPSLLSSGGQSLTIPGQLTIHGVTRPAQVSVAVKVNGNQAQASGSTTFDMTDFGVSPPQVPITTVQPGVTLEFQVQLAKS